jgi:hypothetical protein
MYLVGLVAFGHLNNLSIMENIQGGEFGGGQRVGQLVS